MSNIPNAPTKDLMEYIKNHYFYRDGKIDGVNKEDLGYNHKRSKIKSTYKRLSVEFGGVKYKFYKYHVVWFLCTGEWPPTEIDHINRDSLDDRFENLRLAEHKENQRNQDRCTMYRGFSIWLCQDKPRNRPYRVRNREFKVGLGYFY